MNTITDNPADMFMCILTSYCLLGQLNQFYLVLQELIIFLNFYDEAYLRDVLGKKKLSKLFPPPFFESDCVITNVSCIIVKHIHFQSNWYKIVTKL